MSSMSIASSTLKHPSSGTPSKHKMMPPPSSTLWFSISAAILLVVGISYYSSQPRPANIPQQPIRIFGPSDKATRVLFETSYVHHQIFSKADRLYYLQKHGERCWPNLVEAYLRLEPFFQVELWKYCVLYTGHGNVYQDSGVNWFVDYQDLLKPYQSIVLKTEAGKFHGSFLQLHRKQIARRMCQMLVESENVVMDLIPLLLEELMSKVTKTEYQTKCQDLLGASAMHHHACPLKGGFCCQVLGSDDQILAALRHPLGTSLPEDNGSYYSKITVEPTHNEPAGITETPNFFDILLHNDCLPTSKGCYKCLKKGGSSCAECAEECGCYCKTLCKVRPPPKVITQVWKVHPPRYSKDPSRLIPRLVHQTWFEPVSKDKYPNMSRLIESWKTSGWEYTFYDDDTAAAFLSQHFPPHVREAYDAIIPGAFKADLFRYCVLLIKGGVYADMDVLLEANLDTVFAPDVGFMVPIDEPGSSVGHRSCLWNGLLAVAPGHPMLAQTIELVVNNIRNRFTNVDYDDMLCPPVLSVSHTVDTLFTCGPCILGSAMNKVLNRHMQTEWELGDVDIWKVPSKGLADPRHGIPGRTIILSQNKEDMGAHRFTWLENNIMVAATDMPDYDDRPPTKQHYSRTHEKVGVYGLRNLYSNNIKANEEIRIVVENLSLM